MASRLLSLSGRAAALPLAFAASSTVQRASALPLWREAVRSLSSSAKGEAAAHGAAGGHGDASGGHHDAHHGEHHDDHGEHFNNPTGRLFNKVEGKRWLDSELFTMMLVFMAPQVLFFVVYPYKPVTDSKTWAREQVVRTITIPEIAPDFTAEDDLVIT